MRNVIPRRKIDAISAVFLPFRADGAPDEDAFARHLSRTIGARIQPAVNMDTGFGPQLTRDQRRRILELTRSVLGRAPFVAGAFPPYRDSIDDILECDATPIIFQSDEIRGADDYRRIVADCPRALAFELGPMFAPFGRIYDADTFRRLMEIPNLVGLKHSSLSRVEEFVRLDLRDRDRPDFRIYTGNDLAIDMVMYGSDYLLGLSTFDPEAFGLRDRLWEQGDDGFFALNDALQALGTVAFRDPVPAYKDSAAVYLGLRPHPDCPRRPAWEAELLDPFRQRIRGRSPFPQIDAERGQSTKGQVPK